MSWRTIVINKNTYCKVVNNHITISKDEKQLLKVPIEEVKIVLLNSNIVSFSAPFISECLVNKIMVIHLNNKLQPLGYTLPYFTTVNPYYNVKLQLSLTEPQRKRLWKNIVSVKCTNQVKLLEILNLDTSLIESLNQRIKQIKLDDKTNVEGLIAREFFKNIYGKWFKRFNDDKVNNSLNFGYTIIVSELSRILATKGLILPLGIHHIGTENTLNLPYDLIEPYRAFVDYYIFFNILYQSETDELTTKEKNRIVSILEENIEIENRIMSISDSMWIYVESILSALKYQDFDLIKYPVLKDINNYWDELGL